MTYRRSSVPVQRLRVSNTGPCAIFRVALAPLHLCKKTRLVRVIGHTRDAKMQATRCDSPNAPLAPVVPLVATRTSDAFVVDVSFGYTTRCRRRHPDTRVCRVGRVAHEAHVHASRAGTPA